MQGKGLITIIAIALGLICANELGMLIKWKRTQKPSQEITKKNT